MIKPENCCLRTKYHHARRSPLLSGLIQSEVKCIFLQRRQDVDGDGEGLVDTFHHKKHSLLNYIIPSKF